MSPAACGPIAILGGGGHAKVVAATLLAAGYVPAAVFDDDPAKWEDTVLGVPVRGPIADLESAGFRVAVVAIGDNATRERIARRFPRVEWVTAVHPHAWVHPSVEMGPGTMVFAGAVIQPEARLGAHVIVNTGATVDHDCEVGEFAHLAPGVHLAGGVRIGRGALLGMGSVVVPGRSIGEGTVVGAGAVVLRDVPDRVTVAGVPARVVNEALKCTMN